MKQMKIIPLLIFVAMLAFSVRLVEVVAGVSSLSGAAFAESASEEQHEEAGEAAQPQQGGLVFAEEDSAAPDMPDTPEEIMEDAPMMDDAGDDSKWRDASDEDPAYQAVRQELYEELMQRRKDIETKERTLQTREALLKAAEQELDRKYQELSQLRQEIEKLLETQSDEEKARVASLVKIYEGMKPKDAARIFDTLDLDILVSVVSSMSERKLSPVLAAMNPERARTVTIMLAEQKQLPSLPQSN